MEFKDIVMQRYATKKFDGRTIPEAKIKDLLELIRFAPSAVNLQPWKIKVITDQKTKEDLRSAAFGQEQITTCSHLLVFYANTDTDGLIGKIEQGMKQAGVPDEMRDRVIGLARNMTANMSVEGKIEWAKCQVFLALANAVNGAKALGFDSCPMTGYDPGAVSRILSVPSHLVLTILCPLGYAADIPMPKMRLPEEEIVF
jgi:nitroreductase/dihydropteridine reductase